MSFVYLLLGSNLGNKKKTLKNAISQINKDIGIVIELSSFYETEPWGFTHNEYFLNQVIKVETGFSPHDLLSGLTEIENKFGRTRTDKGYNARTLDIDILFYDDLAFQSDKLTIPHPLMHLRLFTLIPLAELIPDFIHPVLNKPIADLITECDDQCKVVKL